MPLRMDAPLPSLEGGTDWFNGEPITEEDLKGHAVLVHYWAISCGICKESLPDLNRWIDEYGSKGLKIISVHMPRQESDTNVAEVKKAIDEYECANQLLSTTGTQLLIDLKTSMCQLFMFFDAEHKMRHFQAGEKAIKMTEPVIQRVLGLTKAV